MATKRTAKKQLTQDNWEEEDTKEEAGTFIKADTDAIGKRTIRKAVRRLHDTVVTEHNNAKISPFSNLNLTPKPFSFTNTKSISATNGTTEKSSIPDQNSIGTKCLNTNTNTNENSFRITQFVINGQTTSSTSTSNSIVDSKTTKSEHSSEYYKNLAALNKSVSDWIKQHVDKNQYCILTPIFQDYEKYLKSIEESSPENSPETLKSTNSSSDDVTSEEEKKSTTATSSSTFAGFSFTNNKSFNFAASNLDSKVNNEVSAAAQEDEDAEYVPPIPEVNTIQEEGSVYSVKCKLFHKKDDSYIDKGVGTLHLILVDGTTQLLVRTDTTSGLILLNIRLTKSIPFNRLGKNNVSMLCVLNSSDSKNEEQKPVSLLIRVKTAEAADELLSKLNEYKT